MESNIYYGLNANANTCSGANFGFTNNIQATTGNPQAVTGGMTPAVIPQQNNDMKRQVFEELLAYYCEYEDTSTYMEWMDSFMRLIAENEEFYVPIIPRPLSNDVRLYCPLFDELDKTLPDTQSFMLRPVEWESTCYPVYTRITNLLADFPGSSYMCMTFPDIFQQYRISGGVVYTICMTVNDDCIFLIDWDIYPIFSILSMPATVCRASDGEEFWY